MPQSIREVLRRVGEEVGVSPWVDITQERIDLFAKATDDHQWIHVDTDRAAKSPFGGTIAHGYLTLSMLPALIERTFSFAERTMGVNYGLNKVRFTAPVPAGSRIRGHLTLKGIEALGDGVSRLTMEATVEVEGNERPALVAETLSLVYE